MMRMDGDPVLHPAGGDIDAQPIAVTIAQTAESDLAMVM